MGRVETADNGPPFEIHHSREYALLNLEAQRGFPNRIKPPYLTWHFSSWPDLGRHFAEAHSEFEEQRLRNDWHHEIEDFICRVAGPDGRILDHTSSDGRALRSQARDLLRGNVWTFEALPFNPALVFRVEFHEEHVSFTFVLPVDDPSCAENPLFAASGARADTNRRLEKGGAAAAGLAHNVTDPEVDKLVRSLWRDLVRRDDESEAAYRNRGSKLWDKLYVQAWDIAFRTAPAALKKRTQKPGKTKGGGPPGCTFCNFRGVVLPRDWLIKAYGAEEVEAQIKRKKIGREQFIPTDLKDLPSVLRGEELLAEMGIAHERDLLGRPPPTTPRRWNRVSAGRVLVRNPALRHALHWVNGEIPDDVKDMPYFHRRTIANLVLDGRALFVSAFSAALERRFAVRADDRDRAPGDSAARFCVFYCAEAAPRPQELLDRRLDRVILRLHSLGTLRLIALKNLDSLIEIDQQLDLIEKEIDDLGKNARLTGPARLRAINRINRKLFELSNLCTGSLFYRVSRSAAYAEQFRRLMGNLALNRIEGWEPYNEFVSRRLFSRFDAIRRIGERVKYVQERSDRLVELHNSDQSVILTERTVLLTGFAAFFAVITIGVSFDGEIGRLLLWALQSISPHFFDVFVSMPVWQFFADGAVQPADAYEDRITDLHRVIGKIVAFVVAVIMFLAWMVGKLWRR